MDTPSRAANDDADFSDNVSQDSQNHSKLHSFFIIIFFLVTLLFKAAIIFLKILACAAEHKAEVRERRKRDIPRRF